MSFPKGFVWGAAAAAYQIEGAARDDGKGLSVWDMFCKRPGSVKNGDTGDIACDHYYRYKEDVGLMKEIGLKAYRMSLSWPRIIPDGFVQVNEKGFVFYDRLVDELLSCGITLYITLFHWDYPYELYKRGGWLNPDSPKWFQEYTRVVVDRLSDRVTNWMTLNEPQCFIILGHYDGVHAPGFKLDKKDLFQAIHNSLLAHGRSVEAIRKYSKRPCQIGYAPCGIVFFPDTNSDDDIHAAKTAMFSCREHTLWTNTWWMDPVYLGRYPEDGYKYYEQWLPEIKQDDFAVISQPLDFFGCNIYYGTRVRSNGTGYEEVKRETGYAQTSTKWAVTPEALYWGPKLFYE